MRYITRLASVWHNVDVVTVVVVDVGGCWQVGDAVVNITQREEAL